MLRMYFVQQWYGLADEAVEDAVYDAQALRNFMGIDLSHTSVPDATTLMGFRHLLEANDLTKAMMVEVNVMLMERGLLMTRGTLVKREDMQAALAAQDQTLQWHVAKRRKTIEKMTQGWQKTMVQAYEKLKAQVRMKTGTA